MMVTVTDFETAQLMKDDVRSSSAADRTTGGSREFSEVSQGVSQYMIARQRRWTLMS